MATCRASTHLRVNRIAIGQCGGVAPLIALVHSAAQSVHETAAGALWNLAFNPVLETVVSSEFEQIMDEFALIASESTSRSSSIEMAKGKALKSIKSFLRSFFDPQTFAAAAASSSLAPLWQEAESSHIQEAGHLRCSETVIARFFTALGSRHAPHHVALLQDAGAPQVLRVAAAAETAPLDAKVFARIVLRNLE
ncbi:hypothetical protein RHGRI_019319 [Rhododendron griersonianum]|uniref:ARM repeat superfamily protein n=1 Tax=Rhododendron griersonianum TaxID=479676 RepID=A0AAV6JEB0_9ERIC|nr:hypothetical protein RHGRI_019319 [Rhododendron griersonianum]